MTAPASTGGSSRPYQIVALLTVIVDQVTKRIAALYLAGRPRQTFLGDTFRLDYAENVGAFLGLGTNLPPVVRSLIFIGGVAAILVTVAMMLRRGHWNPLPRLGLWLVLAGGVSNLVDRIIRGSVIDFMNMGIGSLRTGIFNVADMALMAGLAMLVFAGDRKQDAGQPSANASGS